MQCSNCVHSVLMVNISYMCMHTFQLSRFPFGVTLLNTIVRLSNLFPPLVLSTSVYVMIMAHNYDLEPRMCANKDLFKVEDHNIELFTCKGIIMYSQNIYAIKEYS